jgi:ankyrin repeat protein
MRIRSFLWASLAAIAVAGGHLSTRAQSDRVDFGRDVQPILRQNCIGCHGPTIQQNRFRLDRRADAMRGGTFAMIGPGNSAGSRLYLRLIGSEFGTQMPPTGALKPEQIKIIKDWIDQGADWPDELSGDAPPRPTPPLMTAVLKGDAAAVRRLLDEGKDPNETNDAGATALMWAVGNAEKAQLLLDRGAHVNARSADGRTPLAIAAGVPGNARVVRLLLERGADPSPKEPGTTAALVLAASVGDPATIRLLQGTGGAPKDGGVIALALALQAECTECVDLLLPSMDAAAVVRAAKDIAPPDFDARLLRPLLARRAELSFKGTDILPRAAATDLLPPDLIKALVDRGADIDAKLPDGQNAVSAARRRGNTAVVDALRKAGVADASVLSAPAPKPAPAMSARAAVERSLPLLQQNDVTFLKKAGCVSCHNNSLTAVAVALARSHGIRVDEETAQDQAEKIVKYLESWRERALQGIGIPGDADTVSYILFGLSAEAVPASEATDAMIQFVLRQQSSAGHWRIVAHRPPIESSDIQVTALSMRSLQVYAPKSGRAEYDAAVRRAATWLANAPVTTTEDRAFQLLGLGWSGATRARVQAAARVLAGEQRKDGGWAQLSTLGSDAYATGEALLALEESGAMTPADPVYRRGVDFLVKSQLADGSWYVPSRALPIQPYFESGFPHGRDQFISAAATNWATAALALSVKP